MNVEGVSWWHYISVTAVKRRRIRYAIGTRMIVLRGKSSDAVKVHRDYSGFAAESFESRSAQSRTLLRIYI